MGLYDLSKIMPGAKVIEVKSEEYKGFTIQNDVNYPYSLNRIIFFPTDEGIDHDYDMDSDGYSYCGNCRWAGSVEEARIEIDITNE